MTLQARPNLPVTSRQPSESNSSPAGISEMLLQPTKKVNWEYYVPSRNCAWAYCLTEHLQSSKVNLTFFSKPNMLWGRGQHGQGWREDKQLGELSSVGALPLPWSNGLATLCCGSFIGSGDSPVLGAGGMSGTASEPQSSVWAAKGQGLYGQREPP